MSSNFQGLIQIGSDKDVGTCSWSDLVLGSYSSKEQKVKARLYY